MRTNTSWKSEIFKCLSPFFHFVEFPPQTIKKVVTVRCETMISLRRTPVMIVWIFCWHRGAQWYLRIYKALHYHTWSSTISNMSPLTNRIPVQSSFSKLTQSSQKWHQRFLQQSAIDFLVSQRLFDPKSDTVLILGGLSPKSEVVHEQKLV